MRFSRARTSSQAPLLPGTSSSLIFALTRCTLCLDGLAPRYQRPPLGKWRGNNLKLVKDLIRRVLLCSLDFLVERPELRDFAFDPVERVLADRGKYVAAIITIIRAYRAAGSPKVCGSLGSYQKWSEMVTNRAK